MYASTVLARVHLCACKSTHTRTRASTAMEDCTCAATHTHIHTHKRQRQRAMSTPQHKSSPAPRPPLPLTARTLTLPLPRARAHTHSHTHTHTHTQSFLSLIYIRIHRRATATLLHACTHKWRAFAARAHRYRNRLVRLQRRILLRCYSRVVHEWKVSVWGHARTLSLSLLPLFLLFSLFFFALSLSPLFRASLFRVPCSLSIKR